LAVVVASMKFLIPFAALVAVGRQFGWQSSSAIVQPDMTFVIDLIGQPFSRPEVAALASPVTFSSLVAALPMLVIAVWCCGSAMHLLAWWVRWRRVAMIVRQASPVQSGRELDAVRRLERIVGLRRPVVVASSATFREPAVFAIWKPVLMWPRTIGERLAEGQFDAILTHELCHVRRRDNLAAAVHMTVEAMFWFHPFVWWIESRLVDERERACDEEVIRLGGDPQMYAESILRTCEFYAESPLVCVAGVAGSDLKRRVEAIMANTVIDKLTLMKKAVLASTGFAAIVGPVVVGFLNGPDIRARSPQTTAEPLAPLTIEVASIKRNNSGEPGPRFRSQSGGFSVSGMPGTLMVQMAFGVQNFQISGAPKWMDTERFDLTIKLDGVAGSLPAERTASVLPALLADRFQLKFHRETKQAPIYALTVGPNGPKLRTVAGLRPSQLSGGTSGYVSGTMDLMTLANVLAWRLERPVVNKTGLSDVFDVELVWTPDVGQSLGPPAPPPPAPRSLTARGNAGLLPMQTPPPLDPSGPSIFTALQEQLGLKLESTRGVVDVLVIDSVAQPTPN
jgi:uncharacterized protein (TIGR03435 family)